MRMGGPEIAFDLAQSDGMPWNPSATADGPSALWTDAAGPSSVYCYNNVPATTQ